MKAKAAESSLAAIRTPEFSGLKARRRSIEREHAAFVSVLAAMRTPEFSGGKARRNSIEREHPAFEPAIRTPEFSGGKAKTAQRLGRAKESHKRRTGF